MGKFYNYDTRGASAASQIITLERMIEERDAKIEKLDALREALKVANSQAEEFERKWYLRGDELDALREAAGKVNDRLGCGCGLSGLCNECSAVSAALNAMLQERQP